MKNLLFVFAVFTSLTGGVVMWHHARASSDVSFLSRTRSVSTASTKRTFPPDDSTAKVVKSEAEWKKILTPKQFYILRQKGTEYAFSGDYKSKGTGLYRCAGCNNILFSSSTKYDSGTGWPSFWQPMRAASVREQKDADGQRIEVLCKRCDGHLGHVFKDGPKPTGLRYCMNSVAMTFQKTK